MEKMKEKTMLWGQTSITPDEVLEEDTRDEFEKATDFAAKYFDVYKECFNDAKKSRIRD